jgi:hypothetical protein
MKILDVEFNDTNSGSFRIVVAKNSNPVDEANLFYREIGRYRYNSTHEYEKLKGFDTVEASQKFMTRIENLKVRTVELLQKLRKEGKKVWGYGASTKGNTLLQYYGIDSSLIEGIAERQPQKYGTLTAGSWIHVSSEEEMRKAKPDYLFILPWHFSSEFFRREKEFLKGGGKFIVPLPELRVIG